MPSAFLSVFIHPCAGRTRPPKNTSRKPSTRASRLIMFCFCVETLSRYMFVALRKKPRDTPACRGRFPLGTSVRLPFAAHVSAAIPSPPALLLQALSTDVDSAPALGLSRWWMLMGLRPNCTRASIHSRCAWQRHLSAVNPVACCHFKRTPDSEAKSVGRCCP
jgi:hypothetical protein